MTSRLMDILNNPNQPDDVDLAYVQAALDDYYGSKANRIIEEYMKQTGASAGILHELMTHMDAWQAWRSWQDVKTIRNRIMGGE